MKTALSLILLLAAPMLSSKAHAQSTYEDLDGTVEKKKEQNKVNKRTAIAEAEVIREIERGWYAKAPVGTSIFFGQYTAAACDGCGAIMRPGTYIALAIGQDFIDKEKASMAWEVAFAQAAHNGEPFPNVNPDSLAPESLVQGDTRTFQGLVNLEWTHYPTRRLGIGIRAGGGVLFAPALVDAEYFSSDPLNPGYDLPAVHSGPHPVGFGGPAFEYYTKLSHFSVGADLDVFYAVGFDLGMNATGYFKYTF